MTIIQAIILGIVQGLTEFVPVSSSGHLVLLHTAFGLEDSGLLFDVALHIGTLSALVLYFYKDIGQLFGSLLRPSPQTSLARLLIIATIPAVISGVLLQDLAESRFRSTSLVAVNLLLVALIMLAAERYALSRHSVKTPLEKVRVPQALAVGMAQAVAIVPGISRSGSTITAGLFAGLDRVAATRMSFFLAIPITFGAILKVLANGEALTTIGQEKDIFIIGILTAFVSGLMAIHFLLRYLARHSLRLFAYYRIVLAIMVVVLTAVF